MTRSVRPGPVRPAPAAVRLGHRAGLVSRLVADLLDVLVVGGLALSILLAFATLRFLVLGPPFALPALEPWLTGPLGALLAVGYLAYGWSASGRTFGKQAAGLRVVTRSGRPPGPGRALLRAFLYVLFPLGLLWVLVSRRNLSLQDIVSGTCVVYDWSYSAV